MNYSKICFINNEEKEEFGKILTYSAPRMLEYFNIAKSVWEIVFDSIILRIKKNRPATLKTMNSGPKVKN